MNESQSIPDSDPERDGVSMTFRPRDRILYIAFAVYLAVALGIMALLYGSFSFIDAGKAFGTFIPAFALLALIAFQLSVRPRCSPLAVCVVFAALLVSAFLAIVIAGAASAAV